MPDAVCNAVRDHLHLGCTHAAGGDSRGAQTHARGHKGAAGLAGDGVLVGGNVHAIQTLLQVLAGALFVPQVNEHQVVVGAAGHQLDPALLQGRSQRLCIFYDLAGVFLELRLQCLAKADSFCCNHMLQRAALRAGEHCRVDALGNDGVVGQNQAAAGSAQGLVGGSGHHVGIGHGALVLAARHQTGNVRHIHHQVCAVAVGDLGQFFKVDGAGVGGSACHQHLGAHLAHLLFQLSVVDDAVCADAVGDKVVVFTGHIHRRTMGQVTALRKIHAHDGIAQLQQGKIHSKVGLCAGMGLDVGVLCPEQLAGALDGNILHLVHIDAAAVVALAGQTLGVLVGQHAAHGCHHGGRNDVLAGDQLNVLALTGQFPLHGCAQFRVGCVDHADGVHHILVHFTCPSPQNVVDSLSAAPARRLLL